LPAKLGDRNVVRVSHPIRRSSEPARAVAKRGAEEQRGFKPPPEAIEGNKNALPDDLIEACRQRFVAFELIGLADLRAPKDASPGK
jgi:hypothetical protein